MIVVMKRGVSPEAVQRMVRNVEELGLKAHVIVGTERTVIAAIGEKRADTKDSLASGPGVADVVPILAPYKVASREVKKEPTQVAVGSLKVGAGAIGIIAGPCSVESEEQILSCARAVKAAGGTALRGGAFKPRTSPYAFQGMKQEGLKLLAQDVEAVILALGPGEVSAPHRSALGWHVFRLDSKASLQGEALARAKQQIRDILFRQKYQARLDAWLSDIKRRAIIEVRM